MSAIEDNHPTRWVPSSAGDFPDHPVFGGEGSEGLVYVGMARHEDAYLVGTVVPEHGCCYVPYGGEAIPKKEYFVLTNPESVNLTWEKGSHGEVPAGALQGGRTVYGETLFIGRLNVAETVSIGKIHPSHGTCYVPYAGGEYANKNYEVLCLDVHQK